MPLAATKKPEPTDAMNEMAICRSDPKNPSVGAVAMATNNVVTTERNTVAKITSTGILSLPLLRVFFCDQFSGVRIVNLAMSIPHMRADIDGAVLTWNERHPVPASALNNISSGGVGVS